MNGRCACGKVQLRLQRRPDRINICNCGLCRPIGAAFGYFQPDEFEIAGKTRSFQRSDLAEVWLTLHFCPACGSTTHYTPTGRAPDDRLGVNMRLFPQHDLEGVPVIYQDGRGVTDADDEFVTTGTGYIGDGKAF